MPTRRRPGRATNQSESVGWSVFHGCDISGGVSVHIHSAGTGVGGYSPDLRRVLAIAREVGLVVIPSEGGTARAFVLAATPAVQAWIEQGFQSERPPWQSEPA
jgi:hypothetical protein